MKIAAFSDTHGMHQGLRIREGTDLAIFCGDYSRVGNLGDLLNFIDWYKKQPATYKLLIPGNHDLVCEEDTSFVKQLCEQNNIKYMQDDLCEINGALIYGSPYTPMFNNWAFMESEQELFKRFKKIPWETDIIACHGPMRDILDMAQGKHVGSVSLKAHIEGIKPKLFLFGHIHTNGHSTIRNRKKPNTECFNVAICDDNYEPVNDITYINYLY